MKHFIKYTCSCYYDDVIRKENNMAENSSGGSDKFLFFLAGAGIGAVLALLFAPKSGRETRDMISRTATDSRDFVTTKVTEGRQLVEEKGRRMGDDFNNFQERHARDDGACPIHRRQPAYRLRQSRRDRPGRARSIQAR